MIDGSLDPDLAESIIQAMPPQKNIAAPMMWIFSLLLVSWMVVRRVLSDWMSREIGVPQCGQAGALSEIPFAHSGHAIIAIIDSPFF